MDLPLRIRVGREEVTPCPPLILRLRVTWPRMPSGVRAYSITCRSRIAPTIRVAPAVLSGSAQVGLRRGSAPADIWLVWKSRTINSLVFRSTTRAAESSGSQASTSLRSLAKNSLAPFSVSKMAIPLL
ncbi:hypothetical protein D3C78_1587130 [compost metagenome]